MDGNETAIEAPQLAPSKSLMRLLNSGSKISVSRRGTASGLSRRRWGGGHTSILDLGLFSRQGSANASISTSRGVKLPHAQATGRI